MENVKLQKMRPQSQCDPLANKSLSCFHFDRVSYVKKLKIGDIIAFGIYSSAGERIGIEACYEAAKQKAKQVNSLCQLVN